MSMSFPGLDTVLAIDWSTIAKTFLGAGLGTAAVQVGFKMYQDRRQRRAKSAYLAMRLAVILDAFTLDCFELVSENAAMEPHPDPDHPNCRLSLPEVGAYPDDADGWTAIDQRLAGGSLALRNRIQSAQRLVYRTRDTYWSEGESSDFLRGTIDTEASMLALEAWDLARALRQKHHLEPDDTADRAVEFLRLVQTRAAQHISEGRRLRSLDGRRRQF